jgi:hypothetical protein
MFSLEEMAMTNKDQERKLEALQNILRHGLQKGEVTNQEEVKAILKSMSFGKDIFSTSKSMLS